MDTYVCTATDEEISGGELSEKLHDGDWELIESSDEGRRWVVRDSDGREREFVYDDEGDDSLPDRMVHISQWDYEKDAEVMHERLFGSEWDE